jgi:hypothetical protein
MKLIHMYGWLGAAVVLGLSAACSAPPARQPSSSRATPSTAQVAPTSEASVEMTLYIGPEQKDCVGVGPQKCLMVKYSPDGEYEFFYDQIQGFTFEPGYAYELRVRRDTVANPPSDASRYTWTLIEIVKQMAGARRS